MAKIGFIGTGKMAEALIKAILKVDLADGIIGSDKSEERLRHIKEKAKIGVTANNREVVKECDIVFLSVKPQDMKQVLEEIKDEVREQLIVSIAAGIKISYIASIIGDKKIARVMPNTPCLVGEMAAGFCVNGNLDEDEKAFISKILNAAGKAFLLKEEQLDAVTALSGSGPAFTAYIIKAMADAGVKQGLSKEVALELAIQTVKGTGKLLQETGMGPEELIEIVSSPGGTTIAGRNVLEKSDLREILMKTIEAAAERSRELGKNEHN
jgi:pyrroline-5-carboxylate reductase